MSDRVTIVAVGDTTEASALRAVLEAMEVEARLLRAGSPNTVAGALRRASEDEVVIFSAHGGPKGVFLGTFGPEVDIGGMEGDWLPMAAAFDGVRFRDNALLISTACATRESGLVEVIVKAGGHLIAPVGYPDGKIIVPWIAACLLQADAGLAKALAAANTLVAPENQFSYG